MEQSPPTEEKLNALRTQLIRQIKEAQQLFKSDRNGRELRTSRAALKYIEHLLRGLRKRPKPGRTD